MGLMQGVEIVKPGTDKVPDAALTAKVMAKARENGLLIGKGGLYGNVLRISPHLNASDADMSTGCDLLAKTFAGVM
jgi:4-aminobutyrate aminotransferase-like enzyme